MALADVLKDNLGTFVFDPKIEHHFSDGLYTKQFSVPKGFMVGQHQHPFSHLSILAKGKVLVKTDDTSVPR